MRHRVHGRLEQPEDIEPPRLWVRQRVDAQSTRTQRQTDGARAQILVAQVTWSTAATCDDRGATCR